LTASKKWWRVQTDVRQMLEDEIGAIVGGQDIARTIINAVNILYRRFIRAVLNNDTQQEKKDKLRNFLCLISEKVVCTGACLFSRLLRTETIRVDKVVPDHTKKGKDQTKVIKEKKTVLVRPKLNFSVGTQVEGAVFARLNGVLSTIESGREDVLGPKAYSTLPRWQDTVQAWVDDLYTRVNAVSKQQASRKQYVRQTIIGRRMEKAAQTGKTALPQQFEQGVNPVEWSDTVRALEQEHAGDWENETLMGISLFLTENIEKLSDVLVMPEEDIRILLRRKLVVG
jgi:hypothetical protein